MNMALRLGCGCAAVIVLGVAPGARAGDWTRLGGDAGMTRHSSEDIAGPLRLDYVKRFYSTFSNDPSPGNYYYAQSIELRNGTAAVFSGDLPPHISGDNFGQGLPLTFFNFATGQTTARTTTPSTADWSNLPLPAGVAYTYPSGRYSLHLGEVSAEIDSGHYTQSVVWADDGKVYARHGGDNAVTASYDPATRTWARMVPLKASPNVAGNYNSYFEGDANAFLQSYGSELLYRPGDTRQTSPYVASDVSAAAYAKGAPGAWAVDLGPTLAPSPLGEYFSGLRYGDIPKIATATVNGKSTGVCVVAGLATSQTGTNVAYSVQLQATNLSTGRTLWAHTFPTTGGGPTGFYTSTPDFWRFLAGGDGTYVFYSGATTRTLEALDMASGAAKWAYTLPAGTGSPLLAANGSSLYVIGNSAQLEMNIDSGKIEWISSRSTEAEATSFMSFEDPVSHPLVVTDRTLWYLDGGNNAVGDQSLVGISTFDGNVIQQIDLSALVAKHAGESLLCVNDIAAADGKLAVLLGIKSSTDPYPTGAPGTSNGIVYQDLYTFSVVPEPLAAGLGVSSVLLIRHRGRRG